MQGYNITLGRGFYANFGCCFLDSNAIEFGDNVMLGPNVRFVVDLALFVCGWEQIFLSRSTHLLITAHMCRTDL